MKPRHPIYFWSGYHSQEFPPFFFIFWCILFFAELDPPPPMEGRSQFWTPCSGRKPVLTPMLLSQFFALIRNSFVFKAWIDRLEGQKCFWGIFVMVSPTQQREKMILNPFLWPGACSDPHVVSPLFCVDSNPWHFQDLNRSSSGSKRGFVMKMAKNVPLTMLINFFLGCRPKNKMGHVIRTSLASDSSIFLEYNFFLTHPKP